MNLIKLATVLSLASFAADAMANEVTITNTSMHSIPIKYQFAYHNPGQPVIFKGISETTVYGNSKVRIDFPQGTYKHAGITILAFKKNPTEQQWHILPDSARQFDENPGCWMNTNAMRSSGNINMAEYFDGNKHGRITCSTHIQQ